MFCAVGGGEGVSVIDGVTGIESIDGGLTVMVCSVLVPESSVSHRHHQRQW